MQLIDNVFYVILVCALRHNPGNAVINYDRKWIIVCYGSMEVCQLKIRIGCSNYFTFDKNSGAYHADIFVIISATNGQADTCNEATR